jgi:glutathione S-transferase
MAGDQISHADLTWFPTAIFMKFMLPRNFGWPRVFDEDDHFPKLNQWFQKCYEDPIFKGVYDEIWPFLE